MPDNEPKRSIRVTDNITSEDAMILRRQIDRHIGHFDAHVEQQNIQWDRNYEAHANTTQAIDRLIILQKTQQKTMDEPIKAFRDFKGFKRVIIWIGGSIVGLSTLIGSVYYILEHV